MIGWSALIVDDSATLRTMLRTVFESKGVTVIEADNGSEGLSRAGEHPVDVILADIHMPVMDGVTMIRKIRALPQHTHTPIFVLSADATSSRLAEGRAAGATAWVIKATDPELLWNGIEKVLQRRDRLARTGEDLRK
jgi:two-component system, chemotaxis family, chemotaxis protein CheY